MRGPGAADDDVDPAQVVQRLVPMDRLAAHRLGPQYGVVKVRLQTINSPAPFVTRCRPTRSPILPAPSSIADRPSRSPKILRASSTAA